MRIGEVEQQTGLPRKTIRFYESKGLLSVERSENSYREYDEAMVKRLKTIAIFRRAGISIADIQLWCDNVISTEEMLKKRLHELKDSVDTASDQLMLCRSLMSGGDMDKFFDSLVALSEDDAAENSENRHRNNDDKRSDSHNGNAQAHRSLHRRKLCRSAAGRGIHQNTGRRGNNGACAQAD